MSRGILPITSCIRYENMRSTCGKNTTYPFASTDAAGHALCDHPCFEQVVGQAQSSSAYFTDCLRWISLVLVLASHGR